jgi:hypothetical protein
MKRLTVPLVFALAVKLSPSTWNGGSSAHPNPKALSIGRPCGYAL